MPTLRQPANNTPPPPPGFELIDDSDVSNAAQAFADNTPPPPPGFELIVNNADNNAAPVRTNTAPNIPENIPPPPDLATAAPGEVPENSGFLQNVSDILSQAGTSPVSAVQALGGLSKDAIVDSVTGEKRTEFPGRPEFLEAHLQASGGQDIGPIMRSAITPDPAAQVDILQKNIPGLEVAHDKFGNVMLKSPKMQQFVYLNAPGLSTRDVDEVGTATLATLPLGGLFGVGGNIATRALSGAASVGGASVAQDVLAGAAGSEQGIDATRAGVSAALGGVLGPVVGGSARTVAASPSPAAAAPLPPPAAVPTPGATVPSRPPATQIPAPVTAAQPAPILPAVPATSPAQAPVPISGAKPDTVTKIITPDGSLEINARPEIVELDTLRLAQGRFQPRDRARSELEQGVRERASRLDPAQLTPSRVSDTGSPVIRDDGSIISGNGRTLSIAEAYTNPQLKAQADNYRASLGPEAQNFRQPVLVMRAEQLSDDQAAQFADLSNRGRIASMSAPETAARDAEAIGNDTLQLFRGGDIDSAENLPFLRAFNNKTVTSNETAAMSKDGRITQEGVARVRAAVLAAAYPDQPLLSVMLESTDDNIRAITGALTDAAPGFSQLRFGIEAGQLKPDLDPTPALMDAVKVLSDLRRLNITPAQHFAQQDAFGGVDPNVEQWIRIFYNDDLTRPISKKRLTEVLRAYTGEAVKHRTGGLFADLTTSEDVLMVAMRGQGGAATPPVQNIAPAASPQPQAAPGRAQGQGVNNQQLPPRLTSIDPIEQNLRAAGARRGIQPELTEAQRVEELAAAGGRLGVDISRAAAAGPALQKTAGALREIPVLGSPLAEATAKGTRQLDEAITTTSFGFGNSDTFSAGLAAREALVDWIKDGTNKLNQRLFRDLDRFVPEGQRRPLRATKSLFTEIQRDMAESFSDVNKPALALIEDAVGSVQGLTYKGLKDLRNDIGGMLDGSIRPAEGGASKEVLARIYGALSTDLRKLVQQGGGNDAVRAFDRAVNISKQIAQRRKSLEKIVGRRGDTAPEAIMDSIIRLAGTKGGADRAKLGKARRAVGNDTWDQIAGGVVDRLGRQPDGGFSPTRFRTAYNRLSPEGKELLFASTGKRELRSALDDIATVSKAFDDLAKQGNPSGTGRVVALSSALSGSAVAAFFNPMTLLLSASGAVSGRVLAHWLARPITAKPISRWMRAHLNYTKNPTPNNMNGLFVASRAFASAVSEDGDVEYDDAFNEATKALQSQPTQ